MVKISYLPIWLLLCACRAVAQRASSESSPRALALCTGCPLGYFGNCSAGTCTPCPWKMTTMTNTSVSLSGCICEAGYYKTGGSCVECPAGRFADEVGLTICKECVAGKYRALNVASSPSQGPCQDCVSGRYSTTTGASSAASCEQCPDGRYAAANGASELSQCQFCDASEGLGGVGCVACDPGKYSEYGAPSCKVCPEGRYNIDFKQSECKQCSPGKYRLGASLSSARIPCSECVPGKYSDVWAANASQVCDKCSKGSSSDTLAATACGRCNQGYYAHVEGGTACFQCLSANQPSSGAWGCCPARDEKTWPVLGELSTAPGKSEAGVYLLSSCSSAGLSDKVALSEVLGQRKSYHGSSEVHVATLKSDIELQDCRTYACRTPHCSLEVWSDHNVFETGAVISVKAFVRSDFWIQCEDSKIMISGFGCAPNTLSNFLIALTSVVAGTIFLGVLLEMLERRRQVVFVETSLDITLPSHTSKLTSLPTSELIRESIKSGLALRDEELPRQHFNAFMVKNLRRGGSLNLHVDYAVRARKNEHDGMRRRLVQQSWVPSRDWLPNAKVEQQSPSIVKAKGSLPGMDLLELVERCCLSITGGQIREEDRCLADLHADVAKHLLTRLLSRGARTVLFLQYIMNFIMAGLLSGLAYQQMTNCKDGFPIMIHMLWLVWLAVSGLSSLCILRVCGGPQASVFIRRVRMRLLIRFVFMFVMLTDTYQDATFPVIAKKCGFDLWFVSAWLVVLGIGIMQVLGQLLVVLTCYYQYYGARTPEERERLFVEGVFLALRGSDNYMLVYALKPAVEERLGGASSWGMKMTEARISFFRFIFEDVEQSALQLVFLIFYEDAAAADKIWVSLSIATALLVSFTLVVQCLPQVRDWLWYRVLPRFPGARKSAFFRIGWFLLCLAVYRLISSFPWISACSPKGDPCGGGQNSNPFFSCDDGGTTLLGLPARSSVVTEVLSTSAICVGAVSLLAILAGCFTYVCSILGRDNRWRDYNSYSFEKRFSILSQEMIRPKSDDDDDSWLQPARKLIQCAMDDSDLSDQDVLRLISVIDRSAFHLTRAPSPYRLFPCSRVGKKLAKGLQALGASKQLPRLGDIGQQAAAALKQEASHAEVLAFVRWNSQKLLSDRWFVHARLKDKASSIKEATGGAASLRLIHWESIQKKGCLPKYGTQGASIEIEEATTLVVEKHRLPKDMHERADRFVVPFFLSHRWLRTRGPRSGHHPDSEDNVKAKKIVAFAKWFTALAKRAGIRCEVFFWIDWCCCDQDNPNNTDVATAALPLYIASCMKVVNWRTPDFDRRCWTMVERLLSYSFCTGGLMPYVIDETFDDSDMLARWPELPEQTRANQSTRSNADIGSARSNRSSTRSQDGCRNSDRGVSVVLESTKEAHTVLQDIFQVNLGSRWIDFSEDAQDSIRKAVSEGQPHLKLHLRGNEYEIDLENMVQRNTATSMERPMRKLDLRANLEEPKDVDAALSARSSTDASAIQLIGKSSARSARSKESLASGDVLLEVDTSMLDRIAIHRRSRKLPNPLDFEVCQVTRPSDRRRVAQLVNTALAVPALEVFADRQPVEWGLTEIIEQSLAVRSPLPNSCDESSRVLEPFMTQRADWQLVVEHVAAKGKLNDTLDAFVWVDRSEFPSKDSGTHPAPPSSAELDHLFSTVDAAVLSRDGLETALRALIQALKLDVSGAMRSKDEESIVAAINRTRDVELPEKQLAIEKVCEMRLKAAYNSQSEVAMRNALRMARTYGAMHTPAFAKTLERQQALYRESLQLKLQEQLSAAMLDHDMQLAHAVFCTARKHEMTAVADQVLTHYTSSMDMLKIDRDIETLGQLRSQAQLLGWKEVEALVTHALEEVALMKALEVADIEENIGAIRAVEKRALEQGRYKIAEKAKQRLENVAARVGERLGLPAEWDVVLDMVGGATSKLLRKTEETETALFDLIQRLVDETFTGWGPLGKLTRTRDRAKEPIAERLLVRSVVYVQNTEGFVNYHNRRTAIKKEMPDGGWRKQHIKTQLVPIEGVSRHQKNPFDYSINEHYLWHGTTPQAAAKITDAEFDIRLAGRAYGCLFGPGIYFAESCMKADEYTRADKRGWFPLILCRVVLGNAKYCDAADPTKKAKELEAACKPGAGFHSILGDREKVRGTFREFIVFDNHQVYPEYIIWYSREYAK